MATKAKQVADAIEARIAQINEELPEYETSGLETNIGRKILRGRAKFEDRFVPYSLLVEGDDNIENRVPFRPNVMVAQTYLVEGYSQCDPDHPNDRAHQIISDLKKVIFNGDHTFGGLAREIRYAGRWISPREDGTKLVAAGIEFEVVFAEDVSKP